LIKQVPPEAIKLNKKLVVLEDEGDKGVRLEFEDGETVIADLVIGADGIRSVSR
jgi:salicylate hydroxylase